MSKKILIVGGVAGGATAAARLRRLDEKSTIILFERGEHISFANCGLPYYIGEEITDRDKLLLQSVEGMSKRFNFDVRNFSEVISICKESKTVTVKNVQTNEVYLENFDELILSPGAKPIVPNLPGLDEAKNIFTLRNIPDTDRIKHFVDTEKPKNAVIIGAGFIGLEMAENLHARGCKVTIIEMGNQVMAPLDFEMAQIVHQHLEEKGVRLILQDGVIGFSNEGKQIHLSSEKTIDTDVTILSIGVRPENELAVSAGLKIGNRGGIVVDEFLQTSEQNIWAIGDAIETKDYIHGTRAMIPLASPANRQGRVVADNIYGKKIEYKGALGTSVAKVFDLTVAMTGSNEKTLRRIEKKFEAVHTHPLNHAGYYPGATPISFKLTFNPETGEIYGLQGVGYSGVEKRIDVVATAIKANMNVEELTDLELAYAPPFSSAKDPVNMLGYIATNIMSGIDVVHHHEIDQKIRDGILTIDVRDEVELLAGAIPGAINIPLNDLRDKVSELDKSKPVILSCQVGLRGYYAARILSQEGFEVSNLSGGYKTYSQFKYEIGSCSDGDCPRGETSFDNYEQMSVGKKLEGVTYKLDVCGLQCPGPIRAVYQKIEEMNNGDILEISVTDPGFIRDIEAWCKSTGNILMSKSSELGTYRAIIKKNQKVSPTVEKGTADGATLVVFNQDLDKAIASFIIATGAAATGKKVTLFFTFWGLNILRKPNGPVPKKKFMENMFGKMMPRGIDKLPISNMNMGGMGSKLIKKIMKDKNVDSLDTLIKNAQDLGVEMIACSMSMDVMGIKQEELIDGIEIGGVGAYIGKAEDANLNLFI